MSEKGKTCLVCDAVIEEGWNYCAWCGWRVASGEVLPGEMEFRTGRDSTATRYGESRMTDKTNLTLHDFYLRIIKPLADDGSAPHMLMMEAWEKTKKGEMTLDLAQQYAAKIVP